MVLNRNRLYLFLFFACSVGYLWLYKILSAAPDTNNIGYCLIKHVTGIPCPSCGSSRSIVSLLHGNFLESIFLNPLGIIVAGIMLFTPVWIFFDLISKKESLLLFYHKFESFVRKPAVAIPLIVLILANWIWNITKGL